MRKILLFGYDYADNFAALSKGAADLCHGLCQHPSNFAIGLEKLLFNVDLETQIRIIEEKSYQIKTLAQKTFHLSWEQLIALPLENIAIKAAKPLVSRAKTLHFQQVILNVLHHHPTSSCLGLEDKFDAASILDYLSYHDLGWAALFCNDLFEIKKAFKSSKVAVEAFFLFSPHFALSEETTVLLKEAHIHPINITKFFLPASTNTFIENACKSLDEKKRLSISMRALGKRHAPRQSPMSISHGNTSSESSNPSSSLDDKMKSTLKDFRGIFSDGDGSSTPTTTIVGNRHYNNDEDD